MQRFVAMIKPPPVAKSLRRNEADQATFSKDPTTETNQPKTQPCDKQKLDTPAPSKTFCADQHSSAHSSRANSIQALDHLDRLVCHEEFKHLVALADKVKQAQKRRDVSSHATSQYLDKKALRPQSSLSPEEILSAVDNMKDRLSILNVVVQRGTFPMTDTAIDDNFQILQQELDLCEACLAMPSQSHAVEPALKNSSPDGGKSSSQRRTDRPSSTEFAKWQVDILTQFMVQHHHHPYLHRDQTQELANRTGLSCASILLWFKNARHVHQQQIASKTRKPAGFVDYLFAAEDRDRKNFRAKVEKAQSIPGEVSPSASVAYPSIPPWQIRNQPWPYAGPPHFWFFQNPASVPVHYASTPLQSPLTSRKNRKKDSKTPSKEEGARTSQGESTPTISGAVKQKASTKGPSAHGTAKTITSIISTECSHSKKAGSKKQPSKANTSRLSGKKRRRKGIDVSNATENCVGRGTKALATQSELSKRKQVSTPKESFDSEPLEFIVDLDDELLQYFATTWHDTPGRIASPPMSRKEKDYNVAKEGVKLEDIGDSATATDPNLFVEFSRRVSTPGKVSKDWQELNVSPIPIYLPAKKANIISSASKE